ncbi:hypothetical protein TPA0598_02_06610 [Streptomyces lydicamycinicus]|uniref:Uncharacterized protein n=1 Tax=Streptomyces lydicamycinicus TaxID=1546107 RepID=A0A0P4R534_9ACTN|nr:hypothetical protein TPA0598_02_06610 [Streptomyces lydicamycinicus]
MHRRMRVVCQGVLVRPGAAEQGVNVCSGSSPSGRSRGAATDSNTPTMVCGKATLPPACAQSFADRLAFPSPSSSPAHRAAGAEPPQLNARPPNG